MKRVPIKSLILSAAMALPLSHLALAANEVKKTGSFKSDTFTKIDTALSQAAQKSAEVPVILILADQAQHGLAMKIRENYQTRIETLEKKIRNLLAGFSPKQALRTQDEEIEHFKMINAQMPDKQRAELRALNSEREKVESTMRREIAAAAGTSVTKSQGEIVRLVESMGGKISTQVAIINAVAAVVPSASLKELASHPGISELVYDAPGKPELDNQISSLGVSGFWNLGYDGGVWDVGVLDSGVDENHSALSSHTFYENYATNGSHGTGVACMYGSTNATYKGLAFGLDSIIVDNAGSASTSMAGADWMLRSAGDDAETINYSWGNGTASSTSWGAMAKFVDAVVNDYDVAWVKSAGNSGAGTTTITQPGENYNALTVANMDDLNTVTRSDDVITSSSSRGPTSDGRKKPDLAAPGNNTFTCRPGNLWGNLGGTSSAAPKVGATTLLLRDAGHWDPMTMKAVLINTADSWEDNNTNSAADDGPKTGREWNKTYGWGYLDVWHASFHRNDYFRSFVYPNGQNNDFRLYKGFAYTGDKATLVWERDLTYNNSSTPTSYRNLSDLDLKMYRESNNTTEGSDTTIRDNAHQVAVTGAGNKVVKVYAYSSSFDGASYERFALATEENFSVATGPRFNVGLTSPGLVFDFAIFTITATVNNTGDLNAHNVNATLNLPGGFTLLSGARTQSLGSITDGTNDTVSWTVRAPFTFLFPLTYTYSVSINSNSYQETFTGSGSRGITVF